MPVTGRRDPMSLPETSNPGTTVRRRSFLVRTVGAIAAGIAAGTIFRLPAIVSAASKSDARVTVRPHPHAVPRTNARPSSHE
jgi:hypothetical protein